MKLTIKLSIMGLAFVCLLCFGRVAALAAPTDAGAPEQKQASIQYVTGVVLSVQPLTPARPAEGMGSSDLLKVHMTSGPDAGQDLPVVNQQMNHPGFDIVPVPGDKIILAVQEDGVGSAEGAAPAQVQGGGGHRDYHVADYERVSYVYFLVAAFIITLLVLGRRVGLKSLFVVGFAIFIILQGLIPFILTYHTNLIAAALLVSALIAVVTQVTVSGWNPKTWSAILGTIGGVTIAGVMAFASIKCMHLTGLDTEEAIMLKVTYLAAVDFREVLFAGVVLGALGAVMDVAISIASAQYEIKNTSPTVSYRELFRSGINVGRDIMGTMSNTLILAYLGSSLPLVLLLSSQPQTPLVRIMNLNLIVTEIVRAITGSIGLLCCIPLTALITAFLLTRAPRAKLSSRRSLRPS